MLLVGWQERHPACKKTQWWGAGVVICLERGADLHTAQLMPLPLTVSCSSKIQIGFTFLVPAHLGSPGQRAVKRVCVYSETVTVQLSASFNLALRSSIQLWRHLASAESLRMKFNSSLTQSLQFCHESGSLLEESHHANDNSNEIKYCKS